MKDKAESRGSTENQANTQSDTRTQQRGAQSSNQGSSGNLPHPGRPDKNRDQGTSQPRQSTTQQPGKPGPVASHTGSTGTGRGQLTHQTHDTANRGMEDHDEAGTVTGRGSQNS